mmetsp:Transcript_6195/g.10050  ORF Transcript_6195/g.10050 Transcript_6195/m.10050 type:complete len:110 (+) Transcript_6195:2475-2804(+)
MFLDYEIEKVDDIHGILNVGFALEILLVVAYLYASFYLAYYGKALFLIKKFNQLEFIQFGKPKEYKGVLTKRLKDLPNQAADSDDEETFARREQPVDPGLWEEMARETK